MDFEEEEFEESGSEDEEFEEEEENELEPPRKKGPGAKPKSKEDVPVIEDWQKYMKKPPTLLQIQEMIEDINGSNSVKKKQITLGKYPHCAMALLYANHPFWQYNLTSKGVKKLRGKVDVYGAGKVPSTIFELLDRLRDRKETGHAAVSMVLRFIQANRLYDDLVYRFLDKNLKIRFNTLSINKVFPNLVPVFGVSLANPIKEDPSKPNEAAKIEKKLNLSKVEWFSSRKLDGVRTVFMIDGSGEIKTYSREGNEFVTLGVAVAELKKLKLKNMVLDTEACIMRPDGTEDFKRIVSEIKKKAGTIKNPKCFVFDMMTMDEFNSGFSTRSYAQRYEIMKRVIGDRLEPVFHVLEQLPLKDMDQLRRQKAETAEREWEGLILRRADAPYEAKRSNNMLKVKNFSVDEFVVTKAEIGPMRLIDEEKKEYTANVLTNVIIDIGGGNTVSVGTGFDEDERIQFAKYPQLIRGKTIAVQYMGRSCDKNGKPSLRHPSFKGLYGKKRKF